MQESVIIVKQVDFSTFNVDMNQCCWSVWSSVGIWSDITHSHCDYPVWPTVLCWSLCRFFFYIFGWLTEFFGWYPD